MANLCMIDGCDRPREARGWCSLHYKRWHQHGDPMADKRHQRGTCSIDGCIRPHYARGWCHMHYGRWRVHGTTDDLRSSVEERFELQHEIRQGSDCWWWIGAKSSNGYGRFSVNGQMALAHRWAYEHRISPIPDGLVIDHLCQNRACVNHDHLQAITGALNIILGWLGQLEPHEREYLRGLIA